jgi:hypothetical protein
MPPRDPRTGGSQRKPSQADRVLIPDDGATGDQDSQNRPGPGKTAKGTRNVQLPATPSGCQASAYTG